MPRESVKAQIERHLGYDAKKMEIAAQVVHKIDRQLPIKTDKVMRSVVDNYHDLLNCFPGDLNKTCLDGLKCVIDALQTYHNAVEKTLDDSSYHLAPNYDLVKKLNSTCKKKLDYCSTIGKMTSYARNILNSIQELPRPTGLQAVAQWCSVQSIAVFALLSILSILLYCNLAHVDDSQIDRKWAEAVVASTKVYEANVLTSESNILTAESPNGNQDIALKADHYSFPIFGENQTNLQAITHQNGQSNTEPVSSRSTIRLVELAAIMNYTTHSKYTVDSGGDCYKVGLSNMGNNQAIMTELIDRIKANKGSELHEQIKSKLGELTMLVPETAINLLAWYDIQRIVKAIKDGTDLTIVRSKIREDRAHRNDANERHYGTALAIQRQNIDLDLKGIAIKDLQLVVIEQELHHLSKMVTELANQPEDIRMNEFALRTFVDNVLEDCHRVLQIHNAHLNGVGLGLGGKMHSHMVYHAVHVPTKLTEPTKRQIRDHEMCKFVRIYNEVLEDEKMKLGEFDNLIISKFKKESTDIIREVTVARAAEAQIHDEISRNSAFSDFIAFTGLARNVFNYFPTYP